MENPVEVQRPSGDHPCVLGVITPRDGFRLPHLMMYLWISATVLIEKLGEEIPRRTHR